MKVLFGILSAIVGTTLVFSVVGITGWTCFLIPLYGFSSLIFGMYTGMGFRD